MRTGIVYLSFVTSLLCAGIPGAAFINIVQTVSVAIRATVAVVRFHLITAHPAL